MTRRTTIRLLAAVVSIGALGLSACSGSSTPSTSTTPANEVDFSKQGDIEYWTAKDVSGNLTKVVEQFNAQHPLGRVIIRELPDNADQQRQQMIQNSEIKNTRMGVLSMDVVWTTEFAANGYVVALPKDQFPTDRYLKAAVDSSTYFNNLYAAPGTSDGGLLYYRKDLLDKYGLQPPKTWVELKAACKKIRAGENDGQLNCYAGQYQKYEGLTVNFAEAVAAAGGTIVGDDGKPNVSTAEAQKGLRFLVDSFKDGTIPKGALTWQEEQGRQAFQEGQLIFHRNWSYVYPLAQKTDGSSKVVGKFDVAPLPGMDGPGVSNLGGHNFAIAAAAENKGTAIDFLKYMTSDDVAKPTVLATGWAPANKALYTDPEVTKAYPFYPTMLKAIETANVRPKAVKYGDVTLGIQDAAYSALQGQTTPDDALENLQSKLTTLTQ